MASAEDYRDNNASQDDSGRDCDEIEMPQCATDAGHPRLIRATRIEKIEKGYCSKCDVFFSTTKVELENHFKGHKTMLPPCVYCKHQVFQYKTDSGVQTYHKCRHDPEESPSLIPAPATSYNIESDMNCNIIDNE